MIAIDCEYQLDAVPSNWKMFEQTSRQTQKRFKDVQDQLSKNIFVKGKRSTGHKL